VLFEIQSFITFKHFGGRCIAYDAESTLGLLTFIGLVT